MTKREIEVLFRQELIVIWPDDDMKAMYKRARELTNQYFAYKKEKKEKQQ